MSFNNFLKKDKIIKNPKSGIPKDKTHLTKNSRRKTTDKFILEMKSKYPDKNWDYSKVVYSGNHRKVCIICHEVNPVTGKEHGEFWTTPAKLLSKNSNDGCPKCSGKYHHTTEEYVEMAKIVHPEYSYDKTVYVNNKTKVCVTCPEHGDFWVSPANHIYSGYGCPKCKIEYLRTLYSKTQEEFEAEVIEKFGEGKFDLSQANYVNFHTLVKLRCIEHNTWFYQRPADLLRDNYRGCPECQKSYLGEDMIKDYLRSRNINFTTQFKIDSSEIPGCPNKEFIKIDFALEYNNRKIWIEYNGEQHYRQIGFFHRSFSDFERQQLRDESLRKYAESQGIELLEIPYTDLSRVPEILNAFFDLDI